MNSLIGIRLSEGENQSSLTLLVLHEVVKNELEQNLEQTEQGKEPQL